MNTIIGIDLFAGAGGLSLGAKRNGIDIAYAVERDPNAAKTFSFNHPETHVINDDIKNIRDPQIYSVKGSRLILFGGPPCQGFSTSNQKTRNKMNPQNWLFYEFVRFVRRLRPRWIVIENVKGITETENGLFSQLLYQGFQELGYFCNVYLLCASDFGIPQKRNRFFLIASQKAVALDFEQYKKREPVSVYDAISDLPSLPNGANCDVLPYKCPPRSEYAAKLRGTLSECSGHFVTKNSDTVIQRYTHIPPGGNWSFIPDKLMRNYKDKSRCHTAIYYRLAQNEPSITIGNYRKSMIIHPWENRGLSVREAARLQSFPDNYHFSGSIGFCQQQVGNAVPPMLAEVIFKEIMCKF